MTSVGRFLVLSVVGLFLVSSEVSAGMFGFGKKTEVHLSPEVKGSITRNGEPVPGAEVYRTLDYDKEYFEQTFTDKEGRFGFPETNVRSGLPSKLMDETRVRQVIGAVVDGKKYLLWYHTPGGINERTAVTRRLRNLHCDLTTPEKELLFRNLKKPDFPHAAFSICRWNDGLEMDELED